MMIISGDTTIDYGCTQQGQFYMHAKVGNKQILRTTPDPERMLRWLIQPEVDKDIQDQLRNRMLKAIMPWWSCPSGDFKSGFFNKDHYLKVVEARRQRGL